MRDLVVQPVRLAAAAPRLSAVAQEVSRLDRLLSGPFAVRTGSVEVDRECGRLAERLRQAVVAYATALEADRDRLLTTARNYSGCEDQVRSHLLRSVPPWLRLEPR